MENRSPSSSEIQTMKREASRRGEGRARATSKPALQNAMGGDRVTHPPFKGLHRCHWEGPRCQAGKRQSRNGWALPEEGRSQGRVARTQAPSLLHLSGQDPKEQRAASLSCCMPPSGSLVRLLPSSVPGLSCGQDQSQAAQPPCYETHTHTCSIGEPGGRAGGQGT